MKNGNSEIPKVCLVNLKGGAGKTTTTMLVAYALADAGKRVGIVDYDPLRTITRWIQMAPMEGIEIAQEGRDYDVILLDLPAGTEFLPQALQRADKVLLVAQPTPLDMWATQDAIDLVTQYRKDISPAILFTRYKTGTELGEARYNFAKQLQVPALNNAIRERVDIQKAAVKGWQALNWKDRVEIGKVALEIFTL